MGVTYIASSKSMPGVVKVGATSRSVAERMADYKGSMPYPMIPLWTCETSDAFALEAAILIKLHEHLIPGKSEWFNCSPEYAIKMAEVCREEDQERIAVKTLRNVGAKKISHDHSYYLGEMIQRRRKNMDMTQQEFADLCGVGRRVVSEIENGKGTAQFDKIMALCLGAGIDLIAVPR